jgi:ATP-dependent RNA helicase DHX37/DHR1
MPQFKPRQRKPKARQKGNQYAGSNLDTNVIEIHPLSQSEKEEKKQRLKEELRAQQPKVSRQKQKRLDKYIVMP